MNLYKHQSQLVSKILIISYFFPPCNLTAAQRIMGWARNLKEHGYEPIIITRNWDIPINQPEDVLLSSGTEIEHVKTDNYEAYYLPYKASLRDLVFTRHQGSPMQKLSRPLTLMNLIFENFSVKSIPHSNLYEQARTILKENKEIKKVIISGNPFNQFYFGYLLEKEFNISWIADYRDDWNTTEIEGAKSGVNSFIRKRQEKSEKKWVASAKLITSVSPHYINKISAFVDRPGEVILNGHDVENYDSIQPEAEKFTITYNGSLYPTQEIEPLLSALDKLIGEGYSEINLQFPGLAFDRSQSERVATAVKKYADHVSITNRIPKEEVIELQKQSDLLVMISHSNTKGIPSSKLYEYIGLQKNVLLYPNDHDIIEETLNDVNLGIICSTEKEIYDSVKMQLDSKRSGTLTKDTIDLDKIAFYSRKHQTKKLAELLDQL